MIKYISIDFCEGKLITTEISGSMYWVGEDTLNSFRTSHIAAMNYQGRVRYGKMEQNHQPHTFLCLKTRQNDPGKKKKKRRDHFRVAFVHKMRFICLLHSRMVNNSLFISLHQSTYQSIFSKSKILLQNILLFQG